MKGFCAKQVNLHYGIEFHNAKFTRNTKFINLPFIIRYLYKIKKTSQDQFTVKTPYWQQGNREFVLCIAMHQCPTAGANEGTALIPTIS